MPPMYAVRPYAIIKIRVVCSNSKLNVYMRKTVSFLPYFLIHIFTTVELDAFIYLNVSINLDTYIHKFI